MSYIFLTDFFSHSFFPSKSKVFDNSGFKKTLCGGKWPLYFNAAYTGRTGRLGCCPANQFLAKPEAHPFTATGSCAACPSGKSSVAGSYCTAAAAVECAAGKIKNAAGTCITCILGKYSDQVSATVCKNCAAGKATSYAGATACTDCAKGEYGATAGAVSCKKCAPGLANSYFGAYGCNDCAVNKYQDESGQAQCKSCPTGKTASPGESTCKTATTSTTTTNCAAGKVKDIVTGSCVTCPTGKSAAAGATACAVCAVNKYQDQSGQAQCKRCPTGKLASPGESTCKRPSWTNNDATTNCAVGTMKDQEGSCVDCPYGKYQDQQGMTVCKNCPPGTSGAAAKATACTDCASGKYGPTSGSTTCVNCAPGKSAGPKSTACAACAVNKYQDQSGQAYCKSCPTGKTASPGQTTCKTTAPACPITDGTSPNTQACTCGTSDCTPASGLFCQSSLNRCSTQAASTSSTASLPNGDNANGGSTGLRKVVMDFINGGSTKSNVVSTYGSIESWDTSQITNLKGVFYGLTTFNADLSKWDVSKVFTLENSKFNSLILCSTFSVGKKMLTIFFPFFPIPSTVNNVYSVLQNTKF